jgi:hypothetical protein
MGKKIRFLILAATMGASWSGFAGETIQTQPASTDENKNSTDLFWLATNYTLNSDFFVKRMGDGDSLYNDFTYDHRFLVTGNWYLRTGVEYERYDFSGTNNGLPDHLQAAYTHIAYEYVVHDHAAASVEIDPGAYFQEKLNTGSIDMPWKIFGTVPLKTDKIFAVIGIGGGLNQDPIVAPGGGLIWLFNDHLRLQGVFPKPALVYNPDDNWEFRLLGELNYDDFRTDDVITPLRKLREHNAVLQYSEERAGFQVRYSGFHGIKILASAGYTFKRSFDFYRISVQEKLDPAPYFQLAFEAKF